MPSEFCRFPVKIMAAYEALKKKKKNPLATRASGKSIVVARIGPTASKRHAGQRAHSQCQGLPVFICVCAWGCVFPSRVSLLLHCQGQVICSAFCWLPCHFFTKLKWSAEAHDEWKSRMDLSGLYLSLISCYILAFEAILYHKLAIRDDRPSLAMTHMWCHNACFPITTQPLG